MPVQPDYSKLPLEELLREEKKLRRHEFFAAMGTGFLVGVMVYGVARNGFGLWYIAIPLGMLLLIYRDSQTQKQALQQVRAEISRRSAG